MDFQDQFARKNVLVSLRESSIPPAVIPLIRKVFTPFTHFFDDGGGSFCSRHGHVKRKDNMPRLRDEISLQTHKASGQFCKCIGMALGRDGKPRPKIWYLGKGIVPAYTKALDLQKRWKANKTAGNLLWEDEPAYKAELESKAAGATGEAPPPTKKRGALLSVRQAADDYLDGIDILKDAQQVSESHAVSQRCRLDKAIQQTFKFGTPLNLERQPLSQLTPQKLKAAVVALAARPMVARHNGKSHRMSSAYAKACINSLKWFCEWLDKHEHWTMPKASLFKDIFKFRIVQTLEEQAHAAEMPNGEPEHFEIDELGTLYANANKRLRAWMVVSLNCGFCGELGDLKRWEVKGTDAKKFIERIRGKVARFGDGCGYARWNLWQESVQAIQDFGATEGDFVFLTRVKKPLLNANAMQQAWFDLLKLCPKVRPLSYGKLRKTGAWLVKKLAGRDFSDMYLAHREPGQNKRYAGQDWDRLSEILVTVRQQLQPMFTKAAEVDAEKNEQKKEKARQPMKLVTAA